MRLNTKEIVHIKNTFIKYFDKNDHLWLFGSRVDDNKQGGDIDFYIETNQEDVTTALNNKKTLSLSFGI